jgi:uncharacterized protein YprB with RNaseH-like and TPR domain
MSELQDQLAALRQRMARVLEECAEKYEKPNSKGVSRNSPRLRGAPDSLPGQEIETEFGKHYEAETFYPAHRRHGSADISELAEMPADLLETLSHGAVRDVPPREWAFLDTETTGLAGGTGTCAFLVGVGCITREGFRVRQFLMRDYGEEASLLAALSQYLEPFRVLITYNGRAFDQPLLETRYRLHRTRPPFTRFVDHVDLLHGARRLWKLRFANCRLVELEQQVLGYEREGDVPGALIPMLYFDYVHSGQGAPLLPVFEHNALDILSLACLTSIVPHAFRDPANAPLRHGSEMTGIGRWLRAAGELEQARNLFKRAVDAGLPDDLLFRTLWDTAALERKLGCVDAALAVWNDLAISKNPFRVKALEELAKHQEHHLKNPAHALELTRRALALEGSASLRKREERLAKRIAR